MAPIGMSEYDRHESGPGSVRVRPSELSESLGSGDQTVNVAALQAVLSMVREFGASAEPAPRAAELPRAWRWAIIGALSCSILSLLGIAFLCACVFFGSPGRRGAIESRTVEAADEVNAMYRRVQPLYLDRFGGPYPAHKDAIRAKLAEETR